MLVPGSAGFDSILELLDNQTISGITAAFDTFVTATAIAYGLMVSAVILPGRFQPAGSRQNRSSDRDDVTAVTRRGAPARAADSEPRPASSLSY